MTEPRASDPQVTDLQRPSEPAHDAAAPVAVTPPVPVGPPRDLRRILRRFGPAVVAIGVAIFASPLADRWPSKQVVEVALDHPADVVAVALTVAPHGEVDPVLATRWNFAPGEAPSRMSAELTVPSGPYDAVILVLREGTAPLEATKRVDLDGNRVTLFAR